MTDDHLAELGVRVKKARIDKGWGKARAAREAAKITDSGTFSTITWGRIENGLGVHDVNRAAALSVLDLDRDGYPIAPADGTNLDPETVAFLRQAISEEVERRLASQAGDEP